MLRERIDCRLEQMKWDPVCILERWLQMELLELAGCGACLTPAVWMLEATLGKCKPKGSGREQR